MAAQQLCAAFPHLSRQQVDSALRRSGGDPNRASLILLEGGAAEPAAPRGRAPDLRRDPEGWFRHFDRDGNGLQKHEVVAGLAEALPGTDRSVLQEMVGSLWALFDTDRSGSISMREFNKRDGLRETLLAQLGSAAPRPSSGGYPTAPKSAAAPGHGASRPSAAAAAAGPEGELREMFPNLPPGRIKEALARCRGDKAAAAEWLMRSPVGAPAQGHAVQGHAVQGHVVQGHVVQGHVVQPTQAFQGAPHAPAYAQNPYAQNPYGQSPTMGHAAGGPGGAMATPRSKGVPKLTGRRRALLMGINYFGTQAQLRGCINDVKNMQSLLEQMGWPRSCMRTLTDDQRGSSMPTRVNIEAGLRWLVQGVQPGDVLFFHYSGHGAQQEDPHGYEEDGMNETILPVDFKSAGMMSDDLLGELIVRHLPEGVRLTAVMDCCHSGTGLDLPYTWKGHGWREETNPYHSLGDVQMFSGCEDDDTSSDASTAYGAAGGAMTTAFCDVLRATPGVNYADLIRMLNHTMRRRGFSQQAQLTSTQAFDFNRPFLLDDIIPNSNQTVGRTFRRRFPPRPRQMRGPLADMLGLGAAVLGGMMLGDVAGGLLGALLG